MNVKLNINAIKGRGAMNRVVDYYTGYGEREWSRLDREPIEFIVNWHYIKKYLPAGGEILDNGAGPGKYAMKLAQDGYGVTLTDLTPRLVEIAKQKAQELELYDRFRGFHVLNATELSLLSNEQYDGVLMLGPLYHLQEEEDRNQAVRELHRVTKDNGIVYVAFRSRIHHVMNSLLHPEHWKPNNHMDHIHEFSQTGIFNHTDEGRYTGAYFYQLEEITPFMKRHGFEQIELIGSTNIGAALNQDQWAYWRNKGEEEYRKLITLLINTASDPSVLGMSSHLLYIGRKQDA